MIVAVGSVRRLVITGKLTPREKQERNLQRLKRSIVTARADEIDPQVSGFQSARHGDRIDHERVARISEFILGAVRRAGGAAELPTWTDETVHGLDEIAAIHRITTELLKRDELPDSVKLTLVQKALVSNVHTRTKQILDRGTVDPKERPWLIRSSQLLLLSVF